MVAIVSGNGLGLLDSSLVNIGLAGASGQSDKGATVNIATGNLIIQALDETLSGAAADLQHNRTYNSQGTTNDGDGDQWRWGGERRVLLTSGTLNQTGSELTRTTGDGHEDVYTWDGSAYISQTGSGAHDQIVLSGNGSNQLVWTEGSSRTIERYNDSTGWIESVRDPNYDGFDFTFSGDKLTKVKDVVSGQTFELVYSGTVGANNYGKLARLDTRETASGSLTRQVYYDYDSSGRLIRVITDLTPSDNSVADGAKFETNYTYDGTSLRVSNITQSDGTGVSFTYVDVGGSYRVSSVTDLMGTTTFSYDTTNRRTDVTNGAGDTWQYFYDANDQLTKVQSELVDGTRQSAQYTYQNGEVKTITDGLGKVLTYTYDSNGNRTEEEDAEDNRITRTYSSTNQLLTETRYATGASGDPETTRYVYDAGGRNNLRYTVSAEGRVTERDYDWSGNVTRVISYTGNVYNVSSLATTATLNEVQLNTWVDQDVQDKTQVEQTEYTYDYRGNLTKTLEYGAVDSNGVGVLSDVLQGATITEYVYSEHGQLLQTINVYDVDYTTKTTVTSFVYDGAGRVISAYNAGGTTTTSYGVGTVTTTNSITGLSTVSSYDSVGRLVNLTSSGSGQNRITEYRYDAAGRLIETEGSDAGVYKIFYDEAGRVLYEREHGGNTTGYTYDANGRLSVKTEYYYALNTNTMTVGTIASRDVKTIYTYDDAGRILTKTTDKNGADLTETYVYDNAGRVIQSTVGDRTTRYFYDKDGLQIGVLNAEGYLTENVYDSVGRVAQTVRYATEVTGTTFTSGDLSAVRAIADNGSELYTHYFYDNQGRQVGVVDEQGFLSDTYYLTAYKRVIHTVRKTPVIVSASDTLSALRTRASVDGKIVTQQYFNNDGQLIHTLDEDGSNTYYTYDMAGRLVRTTEEVTVSADSTRENRLTYTQYNAFGEVTGLVDGEGAKTLIAATDRWSTSLSSDVAISTAIDNYGVQFDYDAMGQKIAEYGADDQKTLYYYDKTGRLIYSINALGEVLKYNYRANNKLYRFHQYTLTINTDGLTGGKITGTLNDRMAVLESSDDNIQIYTTYNNASNGVVDQRKGARGDFDYSMYNEYGELYRVIERVNTPDWQPGVTLNTNTLYYYDDLGRQIGTKEFNGTSLDHSETYYDGFNRVIETKSARGSRHYLSYQDDGRTILTTDALGRTTKVTYDATGRVLTSWDGNDQATQYTYDDTSNTVIITSPEGVSVTTWYNEEGQTLKAQDGEGNITKYVYDLDGNLIKITDAEGGVTETEYDDSGRVSETTDANGNVVQISYDAANRILERAVDPTGLNIRTTYTYDGQGRQLTVTENAGVNHASDERTTAYEYYADGLVKQIIVDPNGLKLSTSYTYDYTGNVLTKSEGTVSDPAQRVTSYEYDRKGRLIKEIVDSVSGGLNLTTEYKYDKDDNLTRLIDAGGNSTWYVYNDAGQKSHEINAEGAVVKYDYDKNGRLYHTWAYADALGTSALTNFGDIVTSVSVTENVASDRRSFNVYDDDGRLTYVLSAVGDGKWRVTQNTYDDNGNVIELRQYADLLTSIYHPGDGSNTVINQYSISTDGSGTLTAYDVERSLEEANSDFFDIENNSRLTLYEYDGLNRQIKTTLPGWYDPATGQVIGLDSYNGNPPTGSFQRTIEVTYDAVGNQVKNVIKTGVNTSVTEYRSYDAANRLVHSIDGNGHVTKNGYDALGNLTTITRYESASGSPSNGNYWLASESPESGDSRTITNEYDKAGRNTRTIQPASDSYATIDESAPSNNFNPSSYTGSPETIYEYNDLGQVVKQSVKVNDTDWANTYFYYDGVGRQRWVVDPEKYVTRTTYDGVGNVLTVREYDIPTTDTDLTIDTNASAPSFVGSEYARVWKYEYNQLGQVLVTKRFNAIFTVDQESAATHNNDDVVVSDVTYNAFGEMVENEDVLGNITSYAYNRAGQLTTLTEPVRSVASSGNGFNAATATPITTYSYNAFGDIVSDSRNPNGGTASTQTNTYQYDHVGNMVSRTDAEGHEHTTEYDVAGKVIAEQTVVGSQTVRKEYRYDNVGRQTAALDVFTLNSATHNAGEQVTYNAFGDIEEKHQIFGVGGSESQLIEKYFYTAGGVNYKRESSEGKTYFFYDLTGQLTRQDQRGNDDGTSRRVTEWARDLLGRVIVERQPEFDVISNAITSTATSVTTPILKQEYDRWGNVIQSKVFSGDKNGHTGNDNEYYAYHVSNYEYDHNNQVIKETLPETDVLNADASVISNARLIKTYHYDKAGNLVRSWEGLNETEDTNASLYDRKYYYNEVGQQIKQIDATGVSTEYGYDAFGNQVASRDGVGNIRLNDYNKLGQLTDQALYRAGVQEITDTSYSTYTTTSVYLSDYGYGYITDTFTHTNTNYQYQTVDRIKLNHYEYDEAGRRVSETVYKDDNNRAGGTISYQYDERGNRIKVTDELGYDRLYSYNSQGLQESESYQINAQITNSTQWTYKDDPYAFGQVETRTESAGRITTYSYNDFGQLSKEAYTGDVIDLSEFNAPEVQGYSYQLFTSERNYSYLANGELQEISDEKHWSISAYGAAQGVFFSISFDVVDTRITEYGYDIRTNIVSESIIDERVQTDLNNPSNNSADYLTTTSTFSFYDEHNRLVDVASETVNNGWGALSGGHGELEHIKYQYDAYGNRRYIEASYTKPNETTPSPLESAWYTYDEEGRTLIDRGTYNSSTSEIVVTPEVTTLYSYDGAGRLAQSESSYVEYSYNSAWLVIDRETYEYDDLSNRVIEAHQQLIKTSQGNEVVNIAKYDREVRSYDNRGFLLNTITYSWNGDEKTKSINYYDDKGQVSEVRSYDSGNYVGRTNYQEYDYVGNVVSYDYHNYQGSNFTYSYTNQYDFIIGSEYKQKRANVTSNNGYTPGNSIFEYDIRGNLSKVQITGSGSGVKYFSHDNNGRITLKHENISGSNNTYDSYFYSGDKFIGSVGTNTTELFPDVQHSSGNTPSVYVISGGETLGSIAQSTFGDASLWYLIASENGLSMGPDTSFTSSDSGLRLQIPNTDVSLQNSSDSFKPYNPGEIIGDTTPAPAPPPPPKGCNPIAVLIMVVVAVVAAAVVGPAVSGFLQSSLGVGAGVATAVGTVVGGFVGSVASQGVGIALGEVESFSLRSAVSSGLSAGFAPGGGEIKSALAAGNYAQVALQAVSTYAGNYAANSIAGLDERNSFSWRGLAAQVAGSIAGSYTSGKLGNTELGSNQIVNNTVSGFVSDSLAAKLSNQEDVSYARIALDSFGNALGNSIADRIAEGSVDTSLPSEQFSQLPGLEERLQEKLGKSLDKKSQEIENQALSDRASSEVISAEDLTQNILKGPVENSEADAYLDAAIEIAESRQSQSSGYIEEIIVTGKRPTSNSVDNGFRFYQYGSPSHTEVVSTRHDRVNLGGVSTNTRSTYLTRGNNDVETGRFSRSVFDRESLEATKQNNSTSDLEIAFFEHKNTRELFEFGLSKINFGDESFGGALGVHGDGQYFSQAGISLDESGLNSSAGIGLEGNITYFEGRAKSRFGDIELGFGSTAAAKADAALNLGYTQKNGLTANINANGDIGAALFKGAIQGKTSDIDLGILEINFEASVEGHLVGVGASVKGGFKTLSSKPGVKAYVGAGLTALVGLKTRLGVEVSLHPRLVDAYNKYF